MSSQLMHGVETIEEEKTWGDKIIVPSLALAGAGIGAYIFMKIIGLKFHDAIDGILIVLSYFNF